MRKENILATISAADWHHGKQVWGKEISGGGENWDIHESRSEFENYIAYAKMRVAPYRPDTIVLELLGDWFNVDSPSNTTVSGTVQSEDSRFIKTQTYAEQMLVDAIEVIAYNLQQGGCDDCSGQPRCYENSHAWKIHTGLLSE